MAKTAALLLSRQPLRPCGTTAWVVQTTRAVAWARANNLTLCSSTGMQTWELITALASLERVPLKLFIPPLAYAEGEETSLVASFDLTPNTVEFIHVASGDSVTRESALLRRDEAVVQAADVLIPIAVRRGGHMERLIEQGREAGKVIIEEFRAESPKAPASLAYSLEGASFNPDIDALAGQYLIHWTRATHTAWTGEQAIEYWKAILASSSYPRTACETLRRILSMRCLLASPRHMPQNIPAVAFSALAPREVVPLMRWRARYTEMSFEPYGVAIHLSAAEKLGIVPVKYYAGKAPVEASGEDCWRWQSAGERTDWRQEQEYRHCGNLAFASLADGDLIAVTRFPDEAATLSREFGIKAIPMQK